VEQTREPMNKNGIRGLRCRASGQMIAKPTFIKGTGGKSSGCAWKAVKLTSGEPLYVTETGLRVKRFTLTIEGQSAAGILVAQTMKAQTVGSGK
jgi:hypothetical protein